MVHSLTQLKAALLICTPFIIFGATVSIPTKKTAYSINPEGCGVPGVTKKIFGGQEAKLGAYPWLALLGYEHNVRTPKQGRNAFAKVLRWRCGGALINKRYVLTAAHCSYYNILKIRLGEHNLATDPDCEISCADPVQEISVEEVIKHENFTKSILKNDVALVRMSKDAIITDWVSPICLPRHSFLEEIEGRKVTIAGWGKTEHALKCTNCRTLMEAKKTIQKILKCIETYPSYSITREHQICAVGSENADTCEGDSGTPLMMSLEEGGVPRVYALGVTSFGVIACGSGEPEIYTNVSHYLPWIESKMKPKNALLL